MTTTKKPGPKRKLLGGVRVTLYLDAATLAAATALGDGSPSVGVRRKFGEPEQNAQGS